MGKAAPDHKSGCVAWDGRTAFSMQTGNLAFTTASQIRQTMIIAPCDAYIVAAQMRTLASSTGASSQFNIGVNNLASGLLTWYPTNQLASTIVDLMTASTWVASASKKVKKGDAIYFNLKKSTAVGRIAVSVQFIPL